MTTRIGFNTLGELKIEEPYSSPGLPPGDTSVYGTEVLNDLEKEDLVVEQSMYTTQSYRRQYTSYHSCDITDIVTGKVVAPPQKN